MAISDKEEISGMISGGCIEGSHHRDRRRCMGVAHADELMWFDRV